MNIEEKKTRIKNMLDKMTEDELKEICFNSFLDGLEKGMKIKDIKNLDEQKETA